MKEEITWLKSVMRGMEEEKEELGARLREVKRGVEDLKRENAATEERAETKEEEFGERAGGGGEAEDGGTPEGEDWRD